MTLQEQIHAMAETWVNPEFAAQFRRNYPAMVKELIVLAFTHNRDIFTHPREIRALHRAYALCQSCSWRRDEPAVD